MGIMRDLNLLQPEFKLLVDVFLKTLDEKGIKYHICETLRTKEVQRAYYAQGRQPLIEVNALRKLANLRTINEAENKREITWTLDSFHIKGLAIDLVPLNPTGKLWWGAPDEVWDGIAKISKDCGLVPGWYWKVKDGPHHQMR